MKLPIHLNALKAFEASARHQSFSAAAEELNVTPAAVGQLVRTLEEWLETPLFHRANSGKIRLLPTETAERALPEIRAGFDKLSQGLELLQQSPTCGILTVTVSPAFAAKWLLPRLDRFQALCPETDVRLDTNLKPIDFVIQRVDIGVRYGTGNWQGLVAEKLMEEEVFPVCSPQLLAQADSLIKPEQLLAQTLIHDLSMDEHSGFPTWSAWLDKAGVAEHQSAHNIQINNSAAVLQTAIDGGGIALARSVMVKDDLSAGRLVRLFPDIQFDSPLAYFVVYKPESIDIAKVQVFRDWLFTEAIE
ncbi:transcriptional regulator GcvA [Photobacterium angustum]|uniref:LysR family transcriptional regulator n=1 Tax=Photobacterium angustum TaxID=661 RepID=A0A2S7VL53_PHOAN|nr:transcriptional regulator GcvA [Photobacterium angustum]PQJ62884.1 LysR family transcriptional regulator [Photobacterium angustum]